MKRNSRSDKYDYNFIIIASLALGLWMMLLGISLGINTISLVQNEKKLLSEGASTIGKIINVELDIGKGRSSTQKIFTVEYTDRTNKVLSLTDRQMYSSEEGSRGNILNKWSRNNVTVFYDPSNSSNSVVQGWQDSASDTIIKLAAVAFFEISGLWLIAPVISDIARNTRLSKRATKH